MRIDKFLNTTNITKRRAVAEDMCKSGIVFLNDKLAKCSKEVKIGDIISLNFLNRVDKYEVLAIPTTKNVPKNQSHEYIKKIEG